MTQVTFSKVDIFVKHTEGDVLTGAGKKSINRIAAFLSIIKNLPIYYVFISKQIISYASHPGLALRSEISGSKI